MSNHELFSIVYDQDSQEEGLNVADSEPILMKNKNYLKLYLGPMPEVFGWKEREWPVKMPIKIPIQNFGGNVERKSLNNLMLRLQVHRPNFQFFHGFEIYVTTAFANNVLTLRNFLPVSNSIVIIGCSSPFPRGQTCSHPKRN